MLLTCKEVKAILIVGSILKTEHCFTLCLLQKFHALLSSADIFSKSTFSKKKFRDTISTTVLPTKSDSDILFCLQLLS